MERTQDTNPVNVLSPAGLREYWRLRYDRDKGEKTTNLLGPPLRIFGGPVFCHMLDEIWCRESYRFATERRDPRVIDCGANIGLGPVFVKTHWPAARVTAFEASPEVFSALQDNLRAFGFDDVECINKAVWKEETTLEFALGPSSTTGRVVAENSESTQKVPTTRLIDYLDEPVDFLKMDIEGAETDVLLDCGEQLRNVENLFVEYHSLSGEPQRLDELVALLRSVGFRLYLEKEGQLSRHPLVSVHEYGGFDLAVNIYARRLK